MIFKNGQEEEPMRMKLAGILLLGVLTIAASSPPSPVADQAQKDTVAERLKTFDELDYDVFSNQKWDRLNDSHTDDVTVVWPDGRETQGIAKHIEDLKYMFTYAPDTSIKVHPVKFGSGDWTAVIGVMTGSFSKPMVTPDGKTIQPTGRRFTLQMATISHWKGRKMDKEYLFWDNQTFLKQMGLAE
jgi:hypothetical protein